MQNASSRCCFAQWDSVELLRSLILCLISVLDDVAVIDEIQMLEDPQRGGGWTRALLGLPAMEIHLCGHGCAMDLVQRLAMSMGEKLEVKYIIIAYFHSLYFPNLEGTFKRPPTFTNFHYIFHLLSLVHNNYDDGAYVRRRASGNARLIKRFLTVVTLVYIRKLQRHNYCEPARLYNSS